MHRITRDLSFLFVVLICGASLAVGSRAEGQTYRHVWTTTADFDGGAQTNVNAAEVPDQLQLNLNQIETPYLWVANTSSSTIARIETATGRVLSISPLEGSNPSRTAVDINFDCWVAVRDTAGRAFKLSAVDGSQLGVTPTVGQVARGVAINASGDVWISSSEDDGEGFGWMKINPDTFEPITQFRSDIGSYGIAINPFGKMFSTTSWLGQSDVVDSVQRFDSDTGALEQRWRVNPALGVDGAALYGITVDIDGDVWGAVRYPGSSVVWIDGAYNCPDGAQSCDISEGAGVRRIIDVVPTLYAAGAYEPEAGAPLIYGRGVAVDANRFVWAVFNDRTTGAGRTTPAQQSYAVKIDGRTGDPILAVATGINSVGITPDADGFIWVVNQGGAGPSPEDLPCPEGREGNGTVTKLRSSDGSVVATYPTCGNGPYTYSDMAGYNLRSVTLRSGNWRAVHDSGRPDLEWGNVNWGGREFDDTTFQVRARASDDRDALGGLPFVSVENAGDLPLRGQYVEVEAFFFTRNDFIGPVLEDLTVSSVCIPEDEICDGFDNDCDGVIDNGNPGGGAPCETGLDGVCSQGAQTCVGGTYECQAVLTPVDEVCNGRDDNCNGRVDEGVTNLCGTCGPLPVEVCDGEDNDCDTLMDEGVMNACGTCGEAPTEECDGEDNDCDGLTDEGLLNACGTCGDAPEEICDDEDNDCDGLVDESVINNCGTCGPAPEEICDGIDNDCDGLADEDLRNRCGTCGPAPEEVCNGVDDDCDGLTDEEVLNPCGFCGPTPEEVCDGVDNNCDGATDEGLTNACGGCGAIPSEMCNGVDDDCDGDVDEGVVNACGTCGLLPDEVCNGVDDDCDGDVDEGVLNTCGLCGPDPTDVCNGVDDDCDGDVDEDPECPTDQTCVSGECVEPCAQNECARGFVCVEGWCQTDACIGRVCPDGEMCLLGECLDENALLCRNTECDAEGAVCVRGTCVEDPCSAVDCADGTSCWLGECLEDDVVACLEVDCAPGQRCEAGACVDDPCAAVVCPTGERCAEGSCEDACLSTVCDAGFTCRRGFCQQEPCFGVTCDAGQACQEGNCVWAACVDAVCGPDEQCGEGGCEPRGSCGEAICVSGELCVGGRCVDESAVGSGGSDGSGSGGGTGSGGSGSGGEGGSGNGSGGGDTAGAGADSGCAVAKTNTPARSPWMLLGLMFGAVLFQRRRRGGA